MLRDSEEEMLALVQRSETPFLGLLGESLSAQARADIAESVSRDPTADGYTRLLYRYPALFSIHLTSVLMAGMGQTGSFDIYPHIRAALQLGSEPTGDEKAAIWAAFRRAVLRLGLEVSPRTFGHHYMADTYLRQAGVPLAYADDLAEKMLAFAKSAGLPDRDDPEGIVRWQTALEAKLVAPFSRVAQRAVATDSQGFYTSAFIKVHDAGGASLSNALERAMARAFEKLPAGATFRRASVPYLVLNGGFMGVFVPAADAPRTIELEIDDEIQSYQVGVDDEFLSFNSALPLRLSMKDGSSAQSLEIWGDEKPNRMLLFTDKGRFKCRAQLGASDPSVLPPGHYAALSRFQPAGVEAEELSSDPKLFLLSLLLHPGQKQAFTNGPASLTLQGEGRPLAQWTGPVRGTKDAVEFNYGELGLDLWFPLDWLEVSQRRFQVVLSSNAPGAVSVVDITTDEEGHAALSVSAGPLGELLPPGLSRVLAEVRRPGEARTLLRTSVLFWNGLDSVSSGLKFGLRRNPANLIAAYSENFEISAGVIRPRDVASRHLSLSFQLDERRVQTLAWNAPGVFVEVENVSASGSRVRLNRPLGSTEVVSLSSAKQIIVSASDSGELSLGDWVQSTDFSKQSSKNFPASFLASRITAQSNTLGYRALGTSVVVPLLKLVQPHFVHNLSEKVVDGQLVVKLDAPNEIEAIRLRARDVLSGKDIEVELEANQPDWTSNPLGRARLITLHGATGGYVASVYLSLEIWSAAAWTLKFDGRIGGMWGHLQNQRGDQFAVGLISDATGAHANQSSLLADLSALTEKQSLAVFSRVQNELLPCYAESSWTSIKWLAAAWRSLVDRWKGHETAGVSVLVDMACTRPSEDSAPSWMPQQYIGADLPSIFGLPADEYRKVNESRNPLARALRTLAHFEGEYPLVFGQILHAGSAMGFSNFGAIMKGASPINFSLDSYANALRQLDGGRADLIRLEDPMFMPEPGDYLGPIHFKHARASLAMFYECTLGGNEIRRGQAIGLCRHVRKVMPTVDNPLLRRLKGIRPHIDPWLLQEDEDTTPEESQKQEILNDICHFMSLFALSCRTGARTPESLQQFIERLRNTDVPVEGCLSYLLQVGAAIFALYLLLWEVVLTGEQAS